MKQRLRNTAQRLAVAHLRQAIDDCVKAGITLVCDIGSARAIYVTTDDSYDDIEDEAADIVKLPEAW